MKKLLSQSKSNMLYHISFYKMFQRANEKKKYSFIALNSPSNRGLIEFLILL